jgi:UDP-3-O-[3-hydroxymyristoyl] N-acetylglucosamine deacetylase
VLKQRTLKSITQAVGVGLHSGQRVEIQLRPAAPDTGIVFHRVDFAESLDLPVSTMAVTDTRMATTLSQPSHSAKVQTIEHLLSA